MAKTLKAMLVALALFAGQAGAQFCPGQSPWVFSDVPSTHPFCTEITWMAQREVTLGCALIDPTHRLYCPNGNVTRGEMAAFMYRLGFENAFLHGGNAFAETAVLGTTDNNALDLRVDNSRVMRYEPHAISPNVIGGHPANNVTPGVRGATIGGGGLPAGSTDPDFQPGSRNGVTDAYGTIGGGFGNLAGNATGTTTDAPFATVGGGRDNEASGGNSTVGGGTVNAASGDDSTVAGGLHNLASGFSSTVGGGFANSASGSSSTIGGGTDNAAAGSFSTVIGGLFNSASGFNSLAGGDQSEARGDRSIALGRRAKTFIGTNSAHGAIVLADGNNFDFSDSLDNRFSVRATGGVRFVLGINGDGSSSWVCVAQATTSWSCGSDRALKQNLAEVDGREVLERLVQMPVYSWQPKGEAQVKRIGPTAQDFHAAFGLGDSDKMIGFQDADGVALAAIRGLNAKLEARVAEQAREIAELRQMVEAVLLARAR